MVNESLKRRIQKLESESNRQKFTIDDLRNRCNWIVKELQKLEKRIEDGEAL